VIIYTVTTCLLEIVPFYLQSAKVWDADSDLLSSRKKKKERKKKKKKES